MPILGSLDPDCFVCFLFLLFCKVWGLGPRDPPCFKGIRVGGSCLGDADDRDYIEIRLGA